MLCVNTEQHAPSILPSDTRVKLTKNQQVIFRNRRIQALPLLPIADDKMYKTAQADNENNNDHGHTNSEEHFAHVTHPSCSCKKQIYKGFTEYLQSHSKSGTKNINIAIYLFDVFNFLLPEHLVQQRGTLNMPVRWCPHYDKFPQRKI